MNKRISNLVHRSNGQGFLQFKDDLSDTELGARGVKVHSSIVAPSAVSNF